MTISRPQYEPSARGTPIIMDHISEVHRVPDEPVPTRRRQLLARLDGDIGRGIAVLDGHQHRDGEADSYQYVAYHRNSRGHASTSRSESPTR